VKRAGYNAKVAAENVGTGQASIDEVMKGWKASPGHNKNLLLADAKRWALPWCRTRAPSSRPSGRWWGSSL
jgi:uncharacterized protein YkwD